MEREKILWRGVSGVPGLGSSVTNSCKDSSVLRLWEEGSDEMKDKLTISDRLVKFFSFRRKKSAQPDLSSYKYSSVSLPKVSVRRSVSAVATSHRTKVFPGSGDRSCQNLAIINNKSNIKRAVSFQNNEIKQKEKVDLKTLSEISKDNAHPTKSYMASINVGTSGHRSLLQSSKKANGKEQLKQSTNTVIERKEATNKCQATQTDILENDEDYDYVYSNQISPAMFIKLSEQIEENNEDEENIYEEIYHTNRNVGRSSSLFLSLSEGRRKQLEINKFSGWYPDYKLVMGDSVDKNNYIRPQSLKEELEKKINQQSGSRKKIKENRNVTFAVDGRKLVKSKSVKETSQLVLQSDL